jgi:hypothetical protein
MKDFDDDLLKHPIERAADRQRGAMPHLQAALRDVARHGRAGSARRPHRPSLAYQQRRLKQLLLLHETAN